MKIQLLKIFVLSTLLAAFTGNAFAQTVYDWTNANGTATYNSGNYQWKVAGNWSVNGVTATSYPGQNSNTDIAQFGVDVHVPTDGSHFMLLRLAAADSISIGSFIMQDNSSVDGVQNNLNVQIDGKLNITGAFIQRHSDNLGFPGDGSVDYPKNFDFHIQSYLFGTGTIYCSSFQVGDNTQPIPPNVSNITRFKFGPPDGSAGWNLKVNISGNFTVNSVSRNDAVADTIISVSHASVSIARGTITVGGAVILQNTGTVRYNAAAPQKQPEAWFTMEVNNDGEGKILNLKGANALSIPGGYSPSGQIGSNIFTFWYIRSNTAASATNNLGSCTVMYSGNVDQKIYTNASFPQTTGFFSFVGGNYQNLIFSGTGKKIIDATNATYPLKISGNFTISGATPVDLSTNNPTIVFNNGTNFQAPILSGNYTLPALSNFSSVTGSSFTNGSVALTIPGTTTNGGTFNTTTGTITFAGAINNSGTFNLTGAGTLNFNNSYTNTGTFKATAGTVNINQSGNQSLIDNSVAVVGNSINPQIGGTTFYTVNVLNGSTKTMSGTGQFYVASAGTLNLSGNTTLNAGGKLTLNSDATGSATLTAIPSGCSITGNVTVQRYVSANRAYRLLSSPVYTAAAGGNNVYSVNYLLTNTYLTGTDGPSGLFDKAGNPTLYLYRENLAPLYTTFLNSNFRGIKNLSASPSYTIDSDAGSFNVPVASGFLFYFRGSRKQATLAALTTAGAAATTDTLNAVGTLNQGSITVHDWYTPASATLGYTTVSGDPAVEGFNLVGNPYASSINFEALTSSGIAPQAYYLIPTGLQGSGNYGIYDATLHTGTNGATKVIPSGMGFFVHATGTGATLTFTEAAKVNTQVSGANLFMGKPPVADNTVQYLHLQLSLDTVNTDETIVAFNTNAQPGYDQMEDAQYKTGTGKVGLSSLTSDQLALAINKLPLTDGLVIPLKVTATADGNYALNMKTIKGVPQLYDVWLQDAFKKDSVNMRSTAAYSFAIAKADTNTFGAGRFKLVLRQNPALVCQLTSFTAGKTGNQPQVEVVWKAVNEQNYTHYTVERSTDNGATFEVVGGLLSSGQGTYSLVDKSPVNGANQYRLKQEDLNNKISYSNLVTVQYSDKSNSLTGRGHLSVYPNPAVSTIHLTIDPQKQAAAYSIRVTNSVGAVVKQAVTTQPNWQENISGLLTGTYLIQVVNNQDKSVVGQTKFVKL